MTRPVHDMADRAGAVTYLPALPEEPASLTVVESLRQLHAGLRDGSVGTQDAVVRVQSIIFLATCNRGMQVLREVARKHGVAPREIRSTCRWRHVVAARHEVAYRLVRELEWSTLRAGEFLGRDHATIINSIKAYEAALRAGA